MPTWVVRLLQALAIAGILVLGNMLADNLGRRVFG